MTVVEWTPANPQQQQFFTTTKRYCMYSGAVRAGKSYAGDWKIYAKATLYPGSRQLVTRKNRVTLLPTTIRTLLQIIPNSQIVSHSEFKGKIVIKTILPGVYSEIIYTGLDRRAGEDVPRKIGSNEFSDIFLDEGTETDRGDWDMLVTRLNWVPPLMRTPERWESIVEEWAHEHVIKLAGSKEAVPEYIKNLYDGFNNQMYTATNPDGPHHYLYQLFFKDTDKRPELKKERMVVMTTPYDNAHNLPADYIKSLENTLVGVTRERLLEGQWTSAQGAIYKTFSREKHVNEEILPIADYKDIIAGADANFPKPRACLVLGKTGEGWHVIDEFYKRNAHAEDLAEWLREKAEEYGRTIQVFHDPSSPAVIDKLNQVPGVICDKAMNDVVDGIDCVAKHFVHNTITIHPSCEGTILELPTYTWKKDYEGEKPDKSGNDHAMDALRYAIYTYEGGGMSEAFVLSDEEGLIL